MSEVDLKKRSGRRWAAWTAVAGGILFTWYWYTWRTLGLPRDPAERWTAFWASVFGNTEGPLCLLLSYVLLMAPVYLLLLSSVRDPNSYRTVALLLVIASGVSTTVLFFLPLPILFL
jgi:hypothetical protein